MSLVDQAVLRRDGGTVRRAQKVGRFKSRISVNPIVIIADREPVTLTDRMIYSGDHFIVIVIFWSEETYVPSGRLDRQAFQHIGHHRINSASTCRESTDVGLRRYCGLSWISSVAGASSLIAGEEERL